jgi:DUF1680 family protein
VRVRRAFAAGDVVELSLPMSARWTAPDPRIDALRGQLAVERGPLVLSLESTDLPAGTVNDVRVETDLQDRDGVVTVPVRRIDAVDGSWPYGPGGAEAADDAARVELRPYHSWGNRGPSSMRNWLPIAGADVVAPVTA